MKTRPNEPINAIVSDNGYPIPSDRINLEDRIIGLTKRELFAMEFTKAYITGTVTASEKDYHGWSNENFAKEGIAIADAFINELNKTQP